MKQGSRRSGREWKKSKESVNFELLIHSYSKCFLLLLVCSVRLHLFFFSKTLLKLQCRLFCTRHDVSSLCLELLCSSSNTFSSFLLLVIEYIERNWDSLLDVCDSIENENAHSSNTNHSHSKSSIHISQSVLRPCIHRSIPFALLLFIKKHLFSSFFTLYPTSGFSYFLRPSECKHIALWVESRN